MPLACAASSAFAIARRIGSASASGSVADAIDQRVERLAVEELHHVVLAAVGELAEREDVDDVAVADLVDRARLGDEPRHHLRIDRELASRGP